MLARTPDGEGWVSLVTTLPNRLVEQALEAGALGELSAWRLDRAEASVGDSRLDFLLKRDGARLALEVKSVTLERRGVGLFPDAVTERGTRHLRELAGLARRDRWRAAVLFVAQRDDVRAVTAAPDIDPEFAGALSDARTAGVRVLARRCAVRPGGVALGAAVPAPPSREAPPPPEETGSPGGGT